MSASLLRRLARGRKGEDPPVRGQRLGDEVSREPEHARCGEGNECAGTVPDSWQAEAKKSALAVTHAAWIHQGVASISGMKRRFP